MRRPRRPPRNEPPAINPGVRQFLRAFDLDLAYGPCLGMTRLHRWKRADAAGLHPPAAVRDLLLANPDNPHIQRAELDTPRHAMS